MTRQFLAWCEQEREAMKETWASGALTGAFNTEMAVKNAAATGRCELLKEILDMDYTTLEQVND